MRSRTAFSHLALLAGLVSTTASADVVPFTCSILPGADIASIMITNSLDSNASCMVSCKFSTERPENNPQITCAKPVPAGKEVEMCRLTAAGDKIVKLIEGRAECTR